MTMPKRENLFTGVNPLLMSRLQAYNDFEGFHNQYLAELAKYLNTILPEQYQARPEAKLTLFYRGVGGWSQQIRQPDVVVKGSKLPYATTPIAEESPADLIISLAEQIDDNPEMVIMIRYVDETRLPVLVIELLSPTNKIGRGRLAYSEKRKEFLQIKLNLVEIDFLHATPSPLEGIPIYPQDENATPYYVALSNPHLEDPHTAVYQFGINQPIPKIRLPLHNQDSVLCDFDAVYQTVFINGRYSQDVNYADAPIDLGAYKPSDQTAILAHLAKIRDEA